MNYSALLLPAIFLATPSLLAQPHNLPSSGTVKSLEAGDVACNIEFVADDGETHHEMANFEVCEQEGIIGKRATFSYAQALVLADSCEGNPDCPDTQTVWLIDEAKVQETLDCANAWTTVDMNRCMGEELAAAERELERYLAKSVERYADDGVSVDAIRRGQKAWLEYREAHCGAVYTIWRDGTIRSAMGAGCKLDLTQRRAKSLWESFLTFGDSSPPLLPEPKSGE